MTHLNTTRAHHRAALIAGLALAGLTACAPVYDRPEQVASETPSVSYDYATEDALLEASEEARQYCRQYAATPVIDGSIIDNSDGSNRVTFECVQSGAVATNQTLQPYPAPAGQPRGYVYNSDSELLTAIQSADLYCYRSGDVASTQIVTNPNGTKTLSFTCVPG